MLLPQRTLHSRALKLDLGFFGVRGMRAVVRFKPSIEWQNLLDDGCGRQCAASALSIYGAVPSFFQQLGILFFKFFFILAKIV